MSNVRGNISTYDQSTPILEDLSSAVRFGARAPVTSTALLLAPAWLPTQALALNTMPLLAIVNWLNEPPLPTLRSALLRQTEFEPVTITELLPALLLLPM